MYLVGRIRASRVNLDHGFETSLGTFTFGKGCRHLTTPRVLDTEKVQSDFTISTHAI
jgi:hypothetical protein